MRPTIWLTVVLLIGLASGAGPSLLEGDEQTDTRRPVLQQVSFRPLALGQIKPSGWLREQLKTQAAGLSGHLDEFWPDIKSSAWIGGNAEGWERVPYWLDGIVPLAYLLDDQALQARIKPFIDSILEHQHPDGLEPNFDCCTANLHQGWPKLTSSLWMKSSDGGMAAIAYAPCVVETRVQGKPVKVEVTTDYPFRDTIQIAVTVPELMSFPIHLRKPHWTEKWKKVKDNPQFADWEVLPTTPWNYALQIDREHPERSLTFEERPIGSPPFSAQTFRVIARVKGRRLVDRKIAKGAAAPPPSSPVKSTAPLKELILIPYGCTDLRITEFRTLARR